MLPRCPRQDRVARMRLYTSGLRSNANQAHANEPFAQRLSTESICADCRAETSELQTKNSRQITLPAAKSSICD